MLPSLDFDRHRAPEALELLRSRVRYDCNDQRRGAPIHDSRVLENEGALPALEGAGDSLNRDVTGRIPDGGAACEHLTFAYGLEITVELLVEGHSPEQAAFRLMVHRQRLERDIKGTKRAGHDPDLQAR